MNRPAAEAGHRFWSTLVVGARLACGLVLFGMVLLFSLRLVYHPTRHAGPSDSLPLAIRWVSTEAVAPGSAARVTNAVVDIEPRAPTELVQPWLPAAPDQPRWRID